MLCGVWWLRPGVVWCVACRRETAEVRVEREWAEEALRVERRKNIRLGIVERLDVTLARVQALHNQARVQPLVKEYQVRVWRALAP